MADISLTSSKALLMSGTANHPLALEISEAFQIPVVLRPAIRVCHGRQNLSWERLAANPGRAALESVLHPAKTRYLYFVSKNDGTHKFSRTLKQHKEAVKKFRRGGK